MCVCVCVCSQKSYSHKYESYRWVYTGGSIQVSLYRWVYTGGSILVGLYCWVYTGGSILVSLYWWVYAGESILVSLYWWVYTGGSILVSLYRWVFKGRTISVKTTVQGRFYLLIACHSTYLCSACVMCVCFCIYMGMCGRVWCTCVRVYALGRFVWWPHSGKSAGVLIGSNISDSPAVYNVLCVSPFTVSTALNVYYRYAYVCARVCVCVFVCVCPVLWS